MMMVAAKVGQGSADAGTRSREETMQTSRKLRRVALFGAIAMVVASAASAQEVKVWTLTFANDSANKAWADIVKEFEAANPGVTI